mmetsp:Transcript_71012/g.125817  ORF Transcript_71012/g.125817 Transcript_71012/m.125817 type:complete len:699 (-) Transcript_71012:9-2105(-)
MRIQKSSNYAVCFFVIVAVSRLSSVAASASHGCLLENCSEIEQSDSPNLEVVSLLQLHSHGTSSSNLQGNAGKGSLPRYADCWLSGHDEFSRDTACDGTLKCSRKGWDGRDFGDCPLKHCCSLEAFTAKHANDYLEDTPSSAAAPAEPAPPEEPAPPAATKKALRPNIMLILADDFGWANAGWHNRDDPDVVTPALDKLVWEGLELDRMYVYKYCSPTRSSILSGRLPIHVSQYNNYDTTPGKGVPVGMTLISEKLAEAGYESHMIGKWDIGSASRKNNIPKSRGFSSSLHFFDAAMDHYSQVQGLAVPLELLKANTSMHCVNRTYRDLWRDDAPASDLVGNYSGSLWHAEAERWIRHHGARQRQAKIDGHDPSHPFFMYLAYQALHGPLQVPQLYIDRYERIENRNRRHYNAMAEYVSDSVGNLTQLLKDEDIWDNTLVWFLSDNGGALGNSNNYPLRGGKVSDWEGGVRVNAFVSGGFLPPAARGRRIEGLMHGADIYATLAEIAGVDSADHRAAEMGLPPIDSLSMWSVISHINTTSPRTEVPLATPSLKWGNPRTAPHGPRAREWSYHDNSAGALIMGSYKLIVGVNPNAVWTGTISPNNTNPPHDEKGWDSVEVDCGDAAENVTGCLFNIWDDPSERENLAKSPAHQGILFTLQRRYLEIASTVYDPDRGDAFNPDACAAYNSLNGFVGPYLD